MKHWLLAGLARDPDRGVLALATGRTTKRHYALIAWQDLALSTDFKEMPDA
ncbi:hypothetical protein [Salinicola sp. CPA57]|uniref:hypothetical protein n=1 Tax=Salinicola sp. CPA57 TaxID=1949080 RepID=UPI001300880B|nr:hypothetical protein [Salinicola sp. CPA57]